MASTTLAAKPAKRQRAESRAAISSPQPTALLAWYDRHRRKLPWRASPGERADPFRVWLSEIMLQQTTVKAVAPYYVRFLTRWPDIDALAAAPLDDVLKTWAGLGYYARARNLHACARAVVEHHGGQFPASEAALRALPGIGAYTAAAVAAIAFGRQTAPVDGNIARVLARLLAMEKPIAGARVELAAAARVLAPSRRAGDFAQALMDIGATLCRPQSRACNSCPLAQDCTAFQAGVPEVYPRRDEAKVRPRRQGAVFFARRSDGAFLARRRPPRGLLASTIELPGTPWTSKNPDDGLAGAAPVDARWRRLPGDVEQVFTHFALRLTVYAAEFEGGAPADCFWVKPDAIGAAGFSSMMRKAVKHALTQT